jgi:F-type H+-transporting ATPase subunit b
VRSTVGRNAARSKNFSNREITPVIQLNFTLFIQLINFLLLLAILNAILYKPIIAKLRERDAAIKKDREKAEELEQEVLDQENQHQEALSKARQTAAQEKNALMAEAKQKEAEIFDKARLEASTIVDQMKATIQGESEEVRKTLREQMTPLARSISEKILGRAI